MGFRKLGGLEKVTSSRGGGLEKMTVDDRGVITNDIK